MSAALLDWNYQAVDQAGARRDGACKAASEGEACRVLAAQGLTPIRLRRAAGGARAPGGTGGAGEAGGTRPGRWWTRRRRVRPADVAHFTAQLGVLMSARVPLSEALQGIAEQEPDPTLRSVVTDIATRIESGETLASSLGRHEASFGDIYVQTVRAAERTGNLPRVLEQLSETLERQREAARKLRQALAYPAIVLTVLALAVVFLVGFVLPKFARMFEQRGVPLPGLTQALMHVGEGMRELWWLWIPLAVGGAWGARWAGRQPWARPKVDAALHRVPMFSDLLRGAALARFHNVLALSLASGIGLLDAIALAGHACGRPLLALDAARLGERVGAGDRLADAARSCTYFTPFARRMIAAGETSGELPKMCTVVARHYERETEHLGKALTTFVEPLLVVAITGLVLGVALAIFLPMWDMVKLIG